MQADSVGGVVVLDSQGPTAEITQPLASAVISNAVSVVGTADDTEGFQSYRLDYTVDGSATWRLIYDSASEQPNPGPVVNAELAEWITNDYTARVPLFIGDGNGDYRVRLLATDTAVQHE